MINKLQIGRRCLTCGKPVGEHIGFKCPDNSDFTLGSEYAPLENRETVKVWWKALKGKNGFLIMSKKDKRILEEIVASYIDKIEEVD